MSSKLTLVYLCSDARDVHCHSNLEHSTHVILEHSVNFSIYVHVLVFCGCSLKLISKILTSLYGNTTVWFTEMKDKHITVHHLWLHCISKPNVSRETAIGVGIGAGVAVMITASVILVLSLIRVKKQKNSARKSGLTRFSVI